MKVNTPEESTQPKSHGLFQSTPFVNPAWPRAKAIQAAVPFALSHRCDSANHAHTLAEEAKERIKRNRTMAPHIGRLVVQKLTQDQWSPEQISGWLRKTKGLQISHETIYRRIWWDKAQGGSLYLYCRHQLKHRARHTGGCLSRIPHRVSIHQRPPQADGSTFGDFEMDTVISADSKAVLLTIVERSTNYIWMELLPLGKNAKALSRRVVALLKLYKGKIRSITTDNGTEFVDHEYITQQLGAPVYFADPYASWQKGCIEYHNKLIRQYLPKKEDFKGTSPRRILEIQDKINNRPRKKLGYETPKCALQQALR